MPYIECSYYKSTLFTLRDSYLVCLTNRRIILLRREGQIPNACRPQGSFALLMFLLPLCVPVSSALAYQFWQCALLHVALHAAHLCLQVRPDSYPTHYRATGCTELPRVHRTRMFQERLLGSATATARHCLQASCPVLKAPLSSRLYPRLRQEDFSNHQFSGDGTSHTGISCLNH